MCINIKAANVFLASRGPLYNSNVIYANGREIREFED